MFISATIEPLGQGFLPLRHRLELGLRLDELDRRLQDLLVAQVEIESAGEGLGHVKGRVDVAFEPIALAISW